MKACLLGLFNVLLFCYGFFRIKQETGLLNQPTCIVAVQDQEDVVEFILRYLVSKMRLKALSCRLVVLVGDSRDQTALIVKKMSRQMSIIVREINMIDCWGSSILDLREKKDIKEINVLLNRFIDGEMAKKQSMTGF